jgi:lipopolysaccharide transport system ATP-binding protein
MSDIVIRAENISKLYKLGNVSAATFKEDANKLWAKVRGKEDPTLLLAEVNDRTKKGTSDYVWALKDINFEVKQGDVLGIIGRNGAGKSTLLKILSKVTAPTTGSIKVKGRIASLLEVGTGFHPELTGNENIYLNGHILGMTKKEIDGKLDEIIDFAGVEKYLDTPVKRYSSGMYVRLAFAVAAHLEPEILIIDEVLAVGDAEFQKKCLGKMKNIAGEGRTVLFVSHNLQAVSNLCKTGLLINNGRVMVNGDIEECIKKYMISTRTINLGTASLSDRKSRTTGNVLFTEVQGIKNERESWEFNFDEDILIQFKVVAQVDTPGLSFYAMLKNPFSGEAITNFKTIIRKEWLSKDESITFNLSIPKRTMRPGQYGLYFALGNVEAKIFYDVIDENVNLPMLDINPISMDIHENSGFVSVPFLIQVE